MLFFIVVLVVVVVVVPHASRCKEIEVYKRFVVCVCYLLYMLFHFKSNTPSCEDLCFLVGGDVKNKNTRKNEHRSKR